MKIECRKQLFINTDPKKRCYNGAFASYTYIWSTWEVLETWDGPETEVKKRLNFWKELNDYAVGQRGPSAKREFRIVE